MSGFSFRQIFLKVKNKKDDEVLSHDKEIFKLFMVLQENANYWAHIVVVFKETVSRNLTFRIYIKQCPGPLFLQIRSGLSKVITPLGHKISLGKTSFYDWPSKASVQFIHTWIWFYFAFKKVNSTVSTSGSGASLALLSHDAR